jgi:diaminopimelate decarboxylase
VRGAGKSAAKTGIEKRILRAPAFAYRGLAAGEPLSLFCEDADLELLAERHGTPLYVYSSETIRARLRAFGKAFRSVPHTLCYSVKANSTLAILRLVAREKAGFDVVSGGEVERVMRVKPKGARIVFSGVGKTVPEMELAIKSGILLFNVESASELRTLAATAARLENKASIAIRVNPDVSAKTHPYISTGLHEHKFGVPIPEARKLYAEAAKHPYLNVAGVSVHIGSQITDVGSFKDALQRVAELVCELRGAGHDIRYVDAGGGLGISYLATQEPFAEKVGAYAKAVLEPLHKLNVHLLLEPGRSIVGPAGVLLTRVIYRKTNNSKRFLIVDAAMNDLLRPSLYGAHHEMVPVKRSWVGQRRGPQHAGVWRDGVERFSAAISPAIPTAALAAEVTETPSGAASSVATEVTDVVGPICETGDFFARDRELPVMQEGDLLAILDTGAYGAVLGSNYNTRGRAAEVLVAGAKSRLIRKRETPGDQMRFER